VKEQTPNRHWLPAGIGTAIFGVAVAWLIAHRTALTMDERHTLLVAQAIAGGDWVSFYVGSVTRYEGGSWLIAWPVALLLKAGASGIAATSWTAAGVAILAVGSGSLWLGRVAGPGAALLLGPVCAAAFPEGMHYSYRAWGSICEALVMLPILGLLHHRWASRGRPRRGAVPLAAALAFSWVLSYFHFVTALAFVALEALEARAERRPVGAALAASGAVVSAAAVAFLTWVLLANPHPAEAWVVRDGRSLASTVVDLLLPRLDLVIAGLPGAILGEITDALPLRRVAALGIAGVSVAAGVVVWRRGGPPRRVVVFALLFLPALGVGHALVDPPEVYRYYLPLLAAAAALIAAAGRWTAGIAIVCGAAFWLPSGLAMPYQNPAFTMLELGGNAMHRYAPDPHVKFKLFRPHIPEYQRRWFAFGYGVDSGRRCSPTRAGGAAAVAADPSSSGSPLLALRSAESWVALWDAAGGAQERADYFFGMGVGFAADAEIDRWELEVMDAAPDMDRAEVLLGVGAAITRSLEASDAAAVRVLGSSLPTAEENDLEIVGRGMAAGAAAGRPDGVETIGLTGPGLAALERGLGGAVNRARRAMVRVRTVPTPHPLPEVEAGS